MQNFKQLAAGLRFGRLFSLFAMVALGIARGSVAAVPEEPKTPEAVKAAMIQKFLHYIEWPMKKGEPITIGLLGDDPVARELSELVSGGKPLVAKGRTVRLKKGSSAGDLQGCQLVYIARSTKGDVKNLISGFQKAGVLTVSDTDLGGVIGFWKQGEKICFEIGGAAARPGGLRIGSDLIEASRKR